VDSSLSAAIAAEAARRVERFTAALIPDRLSDPVQRITPAQASRIPLTWNPGSPISARSLILAAENRLEHIDEAILVCTPPSVRKQAGELASADIETVVNDYIKGWFFLVKELTVMFNTRQRGTLALVLSDIGSGGGRDENVDIIGPSVAAAFRALTQGLLSASFDKPWQTLAFSTETGEEDAFAAFVFKIIDEGSKRNAGKWHKYSRLGLFGR
jgi:hypothetical protein